MLSYKQVSKTENQFHLRVRPWISSHVKSKAKIPSLGLISGIFFERLMNGDWDIVVLSMRLIELMQNGIPSLVIWTGQSSTSTPSEMAFEYAKSVQAGKSPLAPNFEITKGLAGKGENTSKLTLGDLQLNNHSA